MNTDVRQIMTKYRFLSVLCMLLTFLPIFMLTGCGKNDDALLSIAIESMEETERGLDLILISQNNTGRKVSFGWVSSCEIEVATSEGIYYYTPFMMNIPQGNSTLPLFVKDCKGEVEKVTITDLRLLNSNGLPGRKLRNTVVYDKEKGINGFEGSFAFPNTLGEKILVIAVSLYITVSIGVVVYYLIPERKKKQSLS